MHKRQEIQQKSRLGLLLINKGLITRPQLDQALRLQSESEMRLGEVLIHQGWITERQLNRCLKKQSRYRYAAAFAALLLGPIQPFMASASMDKELITAEQVIEKKSSASSGLTALTDNDLGEITAKGVNGNIERLQDIVGNILDTSDNGKNSLETLGKLLLPSTDLLDAEIEMSDVTYAEGSRNTLKEDGSIAVALPTHIGQIAFKNVRVQGSEGKYFGDVFVNDIDLSNVDVSIRIHN